MTPKPPILFVVFFLATTLATVATVNAADRLRVGMVRYIGEAQNFLAADLGLFRKHGLEVEVTVSRAGIQGMRKLLRGEVDIATVTPSPVAYTAVDPEFPIDGPRPDFVILANLMQSSRLTLLIKRDDRGINTPRDLEGKTLALTKGTASEYLWHTLALYHNVDTSKVRIENTKVSDMLKALQSGTIDAFIAWEPNIEIIRTGTNIATSIMPSSEFYMAGWLVLARREFAEQNTLLIERYLKALREAEVYIRSNPEEAARRHAGLIGLSENSALRLYPNITFDMHLNEALILNLEAQAKWRGDTNYGGRKPNLDFRSMFFDDPLNAAKPGAAGFLK